MARAAITPAYLPMLSKPTPCCWNATSTTGLACQRPAENIIGPYTLCSEHYHGTAKAAR